MLQRLAFAGRLLQAHFSRDYTFFFTRPPTSFDQQGFQVLGTAEAFAADELAQRPHPGHRGSERHIAKKPLRDRRLPVGEPRPCFDGGRAKFCRQT